MRWKEGGRGSHGYEERGKRTFKEGHTLNSTPPASQTRPPPPDAGVARVQIQTEIQWKSVTGRQRLLRWRNASVGRERNGYTGKTMEEAKKKKKREAGTHQRISLHNVCGASGA
jgi:hypothetical protein